MRITYKGDYALKAVLELASNYRKDTVTIHEMANRLDIPAKFLEQVLLELKRGGFVESRRGRMGGYLLAKSPSQIKLGEVIRFIDGPIEPIACIDIKYKGCNATYKCVFRKIWKEVAKKTSEIIDNITFEDLAKETKKETLVYTI
ncbi:MAG: Rrf2 family transcriptional regulator [Candidatus Omnitrophica bacterium]|nr:Rrf2 family transcriptional regulator [Candidatus Omnitrophota bacterium]